MTLAQQMASDVSSVFLNTDDFAVTIEYRRGADQITLTALVGSSQFDVVDSEAGVVRVETRDYLIQPNNLTFGRGIVLPRRGDEITEGGATYRVTEQSGTPAYSFDDETRQLMKVHTVLQRNAK